LLILENNRRIKMSNVKKETHVDGLGTLYLCNDSAFDSASKAVLTTADSLITLRNLAYARIQEGKDSSVSTNGSYVKEGSLFVPKAANKRIWLRESLVLAHPSDAVASHKRGDEYVLPEGFNVDAHLEQVGKDNYFILTNTDSVPTNRFGEDERTVWLFGDQAKAYGEFLGSEPKKIENVNIWMYTGNDKHIDSQKGPFANQLWLHWLGDNSDVDGNNWGLNNSNSVRGVRYEHAAGVAPKNSDLYSPSQFFEALDKAGLTIKGDLEKTVLDTLRK